MIKLNPNPTFTATVQLTVPGETEMAEISLVFKHMPMDQVPSWFSANENQKSAKALSEIIQGWSGVTGDDGQEVPYSAQALATLLNNYGAATLEIIRAWQKGLTEGRLKN